MSLMANWAINALCLLALPYVIPAVHISGFGTALVVALVLGFLNTLVRPVLIVLTLPISVLSLGLFVFVINGAMFWLAARFLDDFEVAGLGWAVLAALVYSLISWAAREMVFSPHTREQPFLR